VINKFYFYNRYKYYNPEVFIINLRIIRYKIYRIKSIFKKMSTVKDTFRRLNKEMILFPILKRTSPQTGSLNSKPMNISRLHVILFILGNLFVIALFMFIYILL
jgi:hypothetical protein